MPTTAVSDHPVALPAAPAPAGAFVWLTWCGRALFALFLLFGALLLIQVASLAPAMIERRSSVVVQVDRVDLLDVSAGAAAETSERLPHVRVTGAAPRGTRVDVVAGERAIGSTYVREDGRFVADVYVPWLASSLSVLMTDPLFHDALRWPAPFDWWPVGVRQPSIAVATYSSDLHLLWVAGESPSRKPVSLVTDRGVTYTASARWDGIFNLLERIDGDPPQTVAVRDLAVVLAPGGPTPAAVAVVQTAGLPLARVAEFDVSQRAINFSLRATLPAAYPIVRAAVQGYSSASDIVHDTFGWVVFAKDPSVSVATTGETATIDVTGPILPGDVRLWGGYGAGLNTRPFLSTNDSVTVRFPPALRVWFEGAALSELASDRAVWRGPLQGSSDVQLAFGLTRASQPAPEPPPPPDTQDAQHAERLRDFVAGFERRAPQYVGWPVWALKSLIPFVGLLWIARTRRFGRERAWPPLIAAVVIFAGWRIWPFFAWLLNGLLGDALRRVLGPALYAVRAQTPADPERFYDAGSSAFWLIFVTAVALTPVYFRSLQHAASDVRTWPARCSRMRFAFWSARLALGCAAGAFIHGVTAKGWFAEANKGAVPSLPHWLPAVVAGQSWPALLAAATLVLAVSLAGIRGLIAASGLLAVAVRVAIATEDRAAVHLASTASSAGGFARAVIAGDAQLHVPGAGLIAALPVWLTVLLAWLACVPLAGWLVGVLTPRVELGTVRRTAIATLLVGTAVALPWLPVRLSLLAGGAILALAVWWLATQALRGAGAFDAIHLRGRPERILHWALAAMVIAILVWPLASARWTPRFHNLDTLGFELQDLLVYVLALGLVLLMRDHAREHPSVVLSQPMLDVGVYFFAVLVLNSSTSWLLVPVPLVAGLLLARFWLFRPGADMSPLRKALEAGPPDRRRLLADVLDSAAAVAQFGNIRKALDSKLEAAEISPAVYRQKLTASRRFLSEKVELDEVVPGLTSRAIVFALGHGDLWTNVRMAVRAGAVLAAVPVAIALYQYLPSSGPRYPYPVAGIVTFLVQAGASWLLPAFFFGYYYVHIRGTTGLAKGVNLFVALVVPFAVYRLLSTQSLTDMRPFLLWAGQLFLFSSLVGLVAFDYQLLRANGFRLRDLRSVHNLPTLSAYASSVVAAVAPSVVAILSGRLKDVVTFFLDTVLGGATGTRIK